MNDRYQTHASNAYEELRRELEVGEELLWADRPTRSGLGRAAWPVFFFGITWTAFTLFWTGGAYFISKKASGGPDIAFLLFGSFFFLIGLGMLTAPVWARRSAAKTAYGLTNRRAIIRKPKPFSGIEVQSFHPDRLTSMTRTERSDGSGDLIFEQFTTRQGSGHTTVRRGFVGLKNVREIEDLVRKTLLK